jgi:hypothetical protein
MVLANQRAEQQAKSAPVNTPSTDSDAQSTELNQSNAPSAAVVAPKVLAKLTDLEMAIYNEELAIYKEDKEQYRLDRQGLAVIWTTIEQTVA